MNNKSITRPSTCETVKTAEAFHALPWYLQSIIDGVDDELIVVGKDYRILAANNALLARHNLHKTEVIGRFYYDVIRCLSEAYRASDCPIRTAFETQGRTRVIQPRLFALSS